MASLTPFKVTAVEFNPELQAAQAGDGMVVFPAFTVSGVPSGPMQESEGLSRKAFREHHVPVLSRGQDQSGLYRRRQLGGLRPNLGGLLAMTTVAWAQGENT